MAVAGQGAVSKKIGVTERNEDGDLCISQGELLQNAPLGHNLPFPRWVLAMQTISAVPMAEKRFMRAMWIWI